VLADLHREFSPQRFGVAIQDSPDTGISFQ